MKKTVAKRAVKKPAGPIQHRQGDVFLEEVDSVPSGAKKLDHCIVAQGVATGHSHRVESGAEQYQTSDGTQYVKVLKKRVSLKHHEHATIPLTGPKVYRVVHQREYTPAGDQAVLD